MFCKARKPKPRVRHRDENVATEKSVPHAAEKENEMPGGGKRSLGADRASNGHRHVATPVDDGEKDRLRAKVAQMEKDMKEMTQALEIERQTYGAAATRVRQEAELWRKRAVAAETECAMGQTAAEGHAAAVAQAAAENARVQSELAAVVGANGRLQQTAEEAVARQTQLEEELEQVRALAARLESELEEARDFNATMQSELESANTELATMDTADPVNAKRRAAFLAGARPEAPPAAPEGPSVLQHVSFFHKHIEYQQQI